MITTTLGHLVDAFPALGRLGQEKLALKPAYDVAKLIRLLQPELAHYEAKRVELVKEFGEADGEGFKVPAANIPVFSERMEELRALPVELQTGILVLPASTSLTGLDLFTLDTLVAPPEGS